jgi:L-2-hydroxyglutarate oxidase LhgO
VVGAGIVGLASALKLLEYRPGLRLVVVDKEREVAVHQTGHNSGVVHSGVYYRPGSMKATLCRSGADELAAYCSDRGLPFDRAGKVIVATTPAERPRLDDLLARGTANGVPGLRRISRDELRELEPHAAGVAALHSPATAIVDFTAIARAFADDVRAGGGEVRLGCGVTAIRQEGDGVVVETTGGAVHARCLVNCAGLYSDRVARMAGLRPSVQIVPFRGEYHELLPSARGLVRNLIYPVPDPAFPFLGVHLTRTVHGGVEAGPNAVLALAREGYSWNRIDLRDVQEMARFAGLRSLARTYWRTGAYEMWRSLSRRAFVRSLQALVPDLTEQSIRRAGAGVRAQAVDASGNLVDDFVIQEGPRSLHVLNAPSPAATASLAIGAHIARLTLNRLDS